MGDLLTFVPRQPAVASEAVRVMSLVERRAHLEDALQTSLDAADHIMAALDQWDDEDGAVIESKPFPVVTAAEPIQLPEPIEVQKSQPEITSTPISEPIEPALPLRWYGGGNIISATGIALFELVAGS